MSKVRVKTFDRFDDIADGNVVLVLSFLDELELTYASLMSAKLSKLSKLNELWLPLCMRCWENHYKCQEWLDSAKEAYEKERLNSSDMIVKQYFWKEQFLQKKRMLYHKNICVFGLGGNTPVINQSFRLHFFEPRYRWLASRINELEECDRYICFSSHIPNLNGIGFICKVTYLHILNDGRADITLLPLVPCEIINHWYEKVPNQADYVPKLYCAEVKEISVVQASSIVNSRPSFERHTLLTTDFWHRIVIILSLLYAFSALLMGGRSDSSTEMP